MGACEVRDGSCERFSRVAHICCTGCILPRELRWFKEYIKWPVTRGNNVEASCPSLSDEPERYYFKKPLLLVFLLQKKIENEKFIFILIFCVGRWTDKSCVCS